MGLLKDMFMDKEMAREYVTKLEMTIIIKELWWH